MEETQAESIGPGPLIGGGLLGGYRLEHVLGEGGMGIVWSAHDPDLDRRVAIKVLRSDRASGSLRARLQREARAMARLKDPNVLTVYEVGSDNDRDFIVMELVDGTTLDAWITEQKPARGAIYDALLAAGRGLAAAHAAGLVHRDFKPHNVLRSRDGRVLVTDFGLARGLGEETPVPLGRGSLEQPLPAGAALDETMEVTPVAANRTPHAHDSLLDSPLTQTGAMIGTPTYMAPEQFVGTAPDPRTDQFAFSITAWQALTGKRPYEGTTVQQLQFAAQRGARGVQADLPGRVRAVLVRGLDPDPAQRWPDLVALLRALDRGRRPRVPRWAWLVAAGGAVAIAAVAIAATRSSAAPAWRPVVVALKPEYAEDANAPAISPDGTRILYVAARESAELHAYVMPLAGGEPELAVPGTSLMEVRWSRDGKAILASTVDGRIVLQPFGNGTPTVLGEGSMPASCGPDAIAFVEGDATTRHLVLQVADGTRKVLATATGFDERLLDPRCDADGQHIVFWRSRASWKVEAGDVFVVDRAGAIEPLTTDHLSTFPTFVPGGRSVVYSSSRDGVLQLYEQPLHGGEAHRITFDDGPDLSCDITPDGRQLVFNRDISATIVRTHRRETKLMQTARIEHLLDPVLAGTGEVIAVRRAADRDEIVAIASDGSARVLAPGKGPIAVLGDRVVFCSVADPRALLAVPIAGGRAMPFGSLPRAPLLIAAAGDAIHAMLDGDDKAAWSVSQGGVPAAEGARGLVIPAPDGRWRAVLTPADDHYAMRLVAPGASLTGGAPRAVDGVITWLDGDRLAYHADQAIHTITVADGLEVETFKTPGSDQARIASDGDTWVETTHSDRVTRFLITNFGDRPW